MASEITDENWQAWSAYKRFKAVNRFPDDAIVEWYAGLIREVEDDWARLPAERSANAVVTLVTLLCAKESRNGR